MHFSIFKWTGNGLDGVEVCYVKQCKGTNNTKRCDKMHLIFHLGTLGLHGLKRVLHQTVKRPVGLCWYCTLNPALGTVMHHCILCLGIYL